jgi:predicted PurR-regulated permease PerM
MIRREPASSSFVGRVFVVAVAVVIVWALYLARRALLLTYLSLLLATAASPLVRLVERRALRPFGPFRLPRSLAILIVYLLVIGAVVGIGLIIVPPILPQIRALQAEAPPLLDQAQSFLVRHGLLQHRMNWQELFHEAPTGDIATALGATLWQLTGGLIGAGAIVFLTFYLLVESRMLFEEVLALFPRERHAQLREGSVAVVHKVSAWLTGHLLLGCITGISTAIALGLLGVPYFHVLAVLSFVGEFFPYVGPSLSAVPAIAIGLSISWARAIEVGIFFLILQQPRAICWCRISSSARSA